MAISSKEAEAKVRSWGFSHIFTWADGPYAFATEVPVRIRG
jgi:hypothetical protein